MLLDNVVFVAVQSKGRRLETTADRRYDLVIESGTSPDTFLNIYFRESVLRHAADSVIRGRAVIAEKNISEKDISIGLGAYVDKLAKQNEDAAGILLKTGEQEYGAYVKKVVVALHKKDRKVYGSFTAANEADIRNMAPQINTGEKGRGKRKAMLQRFDGAVINMTGAEPGDMERLLRLLRQNVRASALLVVIPPAALPADDAALQYARDNGIYLNMNLTSVATSVEAIKGFDSGYIGSGLDLEETDRDRISRFFGDVLPQLPFKVLIVNADELESRLPPGLLDNALLKTALFKILAIREKGPEEIAADQRKLVFALKQKQLQDERSLLDQYLKTIEQMRNRKDGENIAIPEAWRGNSIVAYQMKKLEGNPEAQQVLLEATAGRLLLMNEREKDVKNMERLNTGFADPAVESLLAEALLERELLERATGWQARDAEDVPISMPEAISAAVAIDNYIRGRSRVMRSPAPAKERQQAIEELIAVIKKNADPKVIKTLEMKNIDSAAYKALLSAA
jgi:hypothetical protein